MKEFILRPLHYICPWFWDKGIYLYIYGIKCAVCQRLLVSVGQDVRSALSRAGFEPPRVRSFACPELKKFPSRVSQSTGNGLAHSQGNGPLCKGGTRCSGVFSACVRRSSSLSTKLRGLSTHRRPSFFFSAKHTLNPNSISSKWIHYVT